MLRLDGKDMRQREAAEILGISERHMRRLLKKYWEEGAAGLISRHRGQPSNNRIAHKKRQKVINLLHSRYADFGPTLACEKLAERHGLELSVESVRQVMVAEGL